MRRRADFRDVRQAARPAHEAVGVLLMGDRSLAATPGTRIVGQPEHTSKLGPDWRLSTRWSVGGDARWQSGRIALGNET